MQRALDSAVRCLFVVGCIFAFLCVQVAWARSYDACKVSTAAGSFCTLNVEDLRPTQFGVGLDEVACKKQRFEEMSSSQLQDYLLKCAPRPIWSFGSLFHIIRPTSCDHSSAI